MAPTKPHRTKGPNKSSHKVNGPPASAVKTSAAALSTSSAVNGKRKGSNKGTNGKNSGNGDELRDAIRALGGGEEDYALIKDLDADEEEDEQEFDGGGLANVRSSFYIALRYLCHPDSWYDVSNKGQNDKRDQRLHEKARFQVCQ